MSLNLITGTTLMFIKWLLTFLKSSLKIDSFYWQQAYKIRLLSTSQQRIPLQSLVDLMRLFHQFWRAIEYILLSCPSRLEISGEFESGGWGW